MASDETWATLEMLVDRAKLGDAEAVQRVVEHYMPAIKMLALKFYGPGIEHGDLMTSALVSITRTLHTFDPALGGINNFVLTNARRGMYTEILHSHRLKSSPLNDAVADMFLFEDINDGDHRASVEGAVEASSTSSALADLIESESVAELAQRLMPRLTSMERNVFQALLDGSGERSYAELAKMVGCSVKAIDNTLWRVRRKAATLAAMELKQNEPLRLP